jgi:hypothetical protein
MTTNVKHPAPARVRPKVGSRKARTKLLATGQDYISGQAAADPQGKLAPEAQQVSTTRATLLAQLAKRADLKAQLDTIQGAIVLSGDAYATACTGYAGAAATFAGGDASLLATLGVQRVLASSSPATETIVAPVVSILLGKADGEAKIKCHRVPHAGAYQFEYKLEPSQPTDPWLGNAVTKLVSTDVSGLAPGQLLRARARAIGAAPGPWSVEVVGRAK